MIVQHRTVRAFTLIEALIVVIILGIVAAIVIPQFSDDSSDAELSALKTNLHTIRGQLQLYKIQHNDTWPTLASFTAQMTAGTKVDGTASTDYGPYLLSIPDNPYTSTNTVGNGAADSSAWYYDQSDGTFRANSAGQTGYWRPSPGTARAKAPPFAAGAPTLISNVRAAGT